MLPNVVVKQQKARQRQQMLYPVVSSGAKRWGNKNREQKTKIEYSMIKLEPNVNRQVEHSVFRAHFTVHSAHRPPSSRAVCFIYCTWRRIWIDVIWTITRTTPGRTYVHSVAEYVHRLDGCTAPIVLRTAYTLRAYFSRRTTNGWSGFKMFDGNFISGSRFVHPKCRKWPLCQQLYALRVKCELIFHHKVYAFNSNFQFYTMLHTSHRVDCRNENANVDVVETRAGAHTWAAAWSFIVHRSSIFCIRKCNYRSEDTVN